MQSNSERVLIALCNLFDDHREQFLELRRRYGNQHQVVIAMEECSELIQALGKLLRKDTKYSPEERITHLSEEIADSLIVITQMVTLFQIEDQVISAMEAKLKRLSKYLEEKANE